MLKTEKRFSERGKRVAFHDWFRLMESSLSPGLYRHYKGKLYTVLGTARHSETEEWHVVYRQEYGEKGLWVRPLEMFIESVVVDGRTVARFEFVGEE